MNLTPAEICENRIKAARTEYNQQARLDANDTTAETRQAAAWERFLTERDAAYAEYKAAGQRAYAAQNAAWIGSR